jgi:hypothetical protein
LQDISEKKVKIPNQYGISAILLSAVNILLRHRFGSFSVCREELSSPLHNPDKPERPGLPGNSKSQIRT